MSFLKSLKGYLKFLMIEKKNKDKINIYIYSEGLNYRNYFFNILKRLKNNKNICVLYFTSDEKDLIPIDKDIIPIYIGDGLIRILFFKRLECHLMLMTLTDLGNHEITKTKLCKKYAYIFHSLVSTHKTYNKNSFNNYDIIFCNGEYQKKEIEKTEKIYNLKKKEIYNTGYPYIEFLESKIQKYKLQKTVLFAPSWFKEKEDLLESYGVEIIQTVLKSNKIVLRPHPQSLLRSKKILKKINNMFFNKNNFEYNQDIFNINPVFESSLLITDNGGLALEYSLILKKPVIYINYKEKIHNKDWKMLNIEPIEDVFKRNFGEIVYIENLKNLNMIIEKTLSDLRIKEKYNNFIDEYEILTKKPSIKIEKIIKKKFNLNEN